MTILPEVLLIDDMVCWVDVAGDVPGVHVSESVGPSEFRPEVLSLVVMLYPLADDVMSAVKSAELVTITAVDVCSSDTEVCEDVSSSVNDVVSVVISVVVVVNSNDNVVLVSLLKHINSIYLGLVIRLLSYSEDKRA